MYFIRKPNNTINVVNFGVHGSIVLYGISWYTESYYKGFLLYMGYDYMADVDLNVCCRRKDFKPNHSLTFSCGLGKNRLTTNQAVQVLEASAYERRKFARPRCSKQVFDLNGHLHRNHGQQLPYRRALPSVIKARPVSKKEQVFFSLLFISFAGRKHPQKITVHIFRHVLCAILLFLRTFLWLACCCSVCYWLYFSPRN